MGDFLFYLIGNFFVNFDFEIKFIIYVEIVIE